MPPAAFIHPQNAPKTPLWELTALPRPLAALRGLLLRGGAKGGEGRERNRRKGEVTGREWRDFGLSQCWKQFDAIDRLPLISALRLPSSRQALPLFGHQ